METAITVALISGAVTLIANVIAIIATNSRTREEIRKELAVQEVTQKNLIEKVAEVSSEVKEHNAYGRQIPVIVEQIKVINHRLDDLERGRP